MALSPAQKLALSTELPVSVCQFLFNLSRPVRVTLKGFLQTMRSELTIGKAYLVMQTTRYDGISTRINGLRIITRTILDANNVLLNALPLDMIYNETSTNSTVKAMSDFLTETIRSLPLKIPAPVFSLLNVDDMDFFAGVKTYKDLADKIDSLEFRLARATAASKYAQDGSFLIDRQLDKIESYITAIDWIGV